MIYRDYFIRNLNDALSGHSSINHQEDVKYSEQSKSKCIGITIETRPDYFQRQHISDILSYGFTILEIGVQSIFEDVARDNNSGHTVESAKQCFKISKDAWLKIAAHMMPDLPNMGFERDIESYKEFFDNPQFRTEGLKLYPTLVIRGTGLCELWKKGKFRNYPPSFLVDLIAKVLAIVPP